MEAKDERRLTAPAEISSSTPPVASSRVLELLSDDEDDENQFDSTRRERMHHSAARDARTASSTPNLTALTSERPDEGSHVTSHYRRKRPAKLDDMKQTFDTWQPRPLGRSHATERPLLSPTIVAGPRHTIS